MSRNQQERQKWLDYFSGLDTFNRLNAGLKDNSQDGCLTIIIDEDVPYDPRLADFVQVETRDEGMLFVPRSLLKKRNLELGGIIPRLETRTLLSHEEWDQCCGGSRT